MAELTLNNPPSSVSRFDGIVIMEMIDDMTGGKVLDINDFTDETIVEGQGVIKEDGTENYKPLPVDGAVPAGHTAAGVVIASIPRTRPAAGVMIRGKVNEAAAKYPYSEAFKAALPLITFTKD